MRPDIRLPRRFRLITLIATFVAAAGVAHAATFVVNVGASGQTTFVDQASGTNSTTIHVGDTVQWNWMSGPHSVTSGTCQPGGGYYGGNCTPNDIWNSGVQSANFSYSRTFDQQGNFPYYCGIHGSMMIGVVFVQAGTGSAPASDFRFQPTGPIVGTMVHFTDASTGTPTSWSWDFGDGHVANVASPSHFFAAVGSYTVTLTTTNAAGSNSTSKVVAVTAGGRTACRADAETLCLSNGRFQVTTQWEKSDGTFGFGQAVPLTSDSGYFWFFAPSNIEMIAKVLNGCGVNGDLWVFGAGLTNVKVILDVLDTSTGVSEQYVNPLNAAFAPIQDTGAFPTCP
jgi:PKD repeat protein